MLKHVGVYRKRHVEGVREPAESTTETISRESKFIIEAKWLGPCKADQKPGDIVMGNGMKMNINDMPGTK